MAKYQDPITKEVIEVGSPDLNPDLIKGKTLVPDTTPLGLISVSNLNSNPTPLNVPAPVFSPIDTTGSQTTIDLFNKYLASQAPASQLSSFLETLGISGETAGQEFKTAKAGVLSTQEAEQTAREELDAINAQLAGLSAEAQAVPIRLQEEATGRGITAGGLAPIQAGELRNVALRTLSLQLPAYLAQAKLAAAQGKTTLAQNAFSLATNQLNKIFDLKTTDTTNAYNYEKDLNEKAFSVASDYQKTLLAAKQKEDDRKFTIWTKDKDEALQTARTLIFTQPDITAKINMRVAQSTGINDTTLGTDVVKIMEGVKAKPVAIPKIPAVFSNTQIASGAATADLPIAEFQKLDIDTQNFFINNSQQIKSKKKLIDDAKTKNQDPVALKQEIQSSTLPKAVKTLLSKYVDNVFPKKEEQASQPWWRKALDFIGF